VYICKLKGKIHGAKVTNAGVEYEGSLTIDPNLMEAAHIVPYEKVFVWSLTTGERLETYAIPGKAGMKEICTNGAAALRIKKGEKVIIAVFAWMDEEEEKTHQPYVVFVDECNRISRKITDSQ